MSTSVRFPDRVEENLARYCASHGVTKSQVLINAVNDYLAKDDTWAAQAVQRGQAKESTLFLTFASRGLVGQVGFDAPTHASATKQRVREAARARVAAK
jgi:predicted transcriptional regulator